MVLVSALKFIRRIWARSNRSRCDQSPDTAEVVDDIIHLVDLLEKANEQIALLEGKRLGLLTKRENVQKNDI